MKDNKLLLPIEIRSSATSSGKYSIRGRAKLIPGKKYNYMFKTDNEGNLVESLKEVFSESGWGNIKKKILSKKVFVDEMHKTVASKNVQQYLSQVERETGKNISDLKKEIDRWMKVSDMPLFKLEDAVLNDDSIVIDMSMNPYFADIDEDHQKYFNAIWNSLKEGYINGISLNFNPTKWDKKFDAQGNEHIPVIHDMDIYGVSLVDTAAHDEMRDVLEVAIRSTQDVVDGGKKMSEEEKKKIKEEVKKELNEESLRAENERLRKEKEAKDAELKRQAEDAKLNEKDAELQKMKEENERLAKENLEKDKQLQEQRIPSRGLVPQQPNTVSQDKEKIKEALDTLKNDTSALGKLAVLQAEFKGLDTLPPETQSLAKSSKVDVVAPKN